MHHSLFENLHHFIEDGCYLQKNTSKKEQHVDVQKKCVMVKIE